MREEFEDEIIVSLETADGKMMAVPESKLEEFYILNEKIKARQRQKSMNTFADAMAATEEMFANAEETPEQTTSNENKKISHETKYEKQKNIDKWMGVSKMNKDSIIKIIKKYIVIVVYAILIVTELFFYVPYNRIQMFRTQNNVTRTEIIGSGYATIANIEDNCANFYDTKYTSSEGKIVNTPQLIINVSITTVLAVALYFVLQKKDKKIIEDDVQIPMLDINALAFADEETIEKEQAKYAKQMVEYIKRKVDL